MEYYFECECGHKSRVSPSQAGTSIVCVCGRTNRLPSLSKLSKEQPKRPEGSVTPDRLLASPAMCLMVVSALSIACLLISLAGDVYLLTSSGTSMLPAPSPTLSKESSIAIRMMWAIAMIFANVAVIVGAHEMKKLGSYVLAKTAAVIAVIPCIGPCFILGIPFGAIALSYLNRPDVRSAFKG